MTSTQLALLLAQPTLLKGVYYSTHKAVVMHQLTWYALTCCAWTYKGDDEPQRATAFRHYLEALDIA